MTLDQLRIFVAVAERQHVTRAAEALNLAQSAVSHAVTQLEATFGLALFSRIGRRIELTDAGVLFLEEARAVLGRAAVARERMGDLAGVRDGALRVLASHTIADYWLPARLNAYRRAYPRIRQIVAIANTREVCRRVQAGEAAIGLVEGDPSGRDLRREIVARDRLLLVVAPDHPWARECPAPGRLATSPWVLREAGSGTRAAVEAALRALGIDPAVLDVLMEIASNEAVASACETGPAATILSASVLASRLEAGLLHHVPLGLPERHFHAIWRRGQRLSPAEHAFLALLGVTP